MAIRHFVVGPLRGLRRAEAKDLGNLVVIAGPNGAGKSTLLELLRSQRHSLAEPGTEVLSAGAYRPWRSEALTRAGAYALPLPSLRGAMALDLWPSWDFGMPRSLQTIGGQPRNLNGSDEAQAFVKAALVKLDDRQSALVNAQYRARRLEGVTAPVVDVPDLFAPFVSLVDALLPHLQWVGVDGTNPADVRCLFRATDSEGGPLIDIDTLSAGEKAVISLMLPFVEQQADRIASEVSGSQALTTVTLLLDEPEIHLHPLLQLQVLEYLRQLAAEGTAQFILTTHSPTLLDALDDSELWLLSPASLRPDNQLSRLTTARERLEVARTLTGSTHLLTRAKPIVFVEGEPPRPGLATDVRLAARLLPEISSWAVVAGRSKREVIASVQQLRQESLDLPGVPVFGLVDADQDSASPDEHVVTWPVAMVENLLLDAAVIYQVLSGFGGLTGATSEEAVSSALERAVAGQVEDEIRIRVKQRLPSRYLRIDPAEVNSAGVAAQRQIDEWLEELAQINFGQIEVDARTEVTSIVERQQALERFHGKRLLQAVYRDLGVQVAMSQPAFQLAVAAAAEGTVRIQRLAQPALDLMRFYFPPGLAAAVRGDGDDGSEALATLCSQHRVAWEQGSPISVGREALREQIFALARDRGGQRGALIRLASEIGTP